MSEINGGRKNDSSQRRIKKYSREKRKKKLEMKPTFLVNRLKKRLVEKKVTGRKKIVGAPGLHRRRKYRYR